VSLWKQNVSFGPLINFLDVKSPANFRLRFRRVLEWIFPWRKKNWKVMMFRILRATGVWKAHLFWDGYRSLKCFAVITVKTNVATGCCYLLTNSLGLHKWCVHQYVLRFSLKNPYQFQVQTLFGTLRFPKRVLPGNKKGFYYRVSPITLFLRVYLWCNS
jgi:hypothetical protein